MAATRGDVKYFEQLIADKQDTNDDQLKRRSRRLSTLLTSLIKSQQSQTTKPADPKTLGFNEYGYTPIHAASFHNHPAVINVLVTRLHASPNQPTNTPSRSLPLHLAIVRNSRAAVKELLRVGANPYLHDGDGMDAFETAVRCRRRRCLSLLNQFVKRDEERCLGVIYGSACFAKMKKTVTNSCDTVWPIECDDCDGKGMRKFKSDVELDSYNTTVHVRKSIPYGPWDVECGRYLAEEGLQHLSDSDIDFPTTATQE